jgi:hypothetical protein
MRSAIAGVVRVEQAAGRIPADADADDIAGFLFGSLLGYVLQRGARRHGRRQVVLRRPGRLHPLGTLTRRLQDPQVTSCATRRECRTSCEHLILDWFNQPVLRWPRWPAGRCTGNNAVTGS